MNLQKVLMAIVVVLVSSTTLMAQVIEEEVIEEEILEEEFLEEENTTGSENMMEEATVGPKVPKLTKEISGNIRGDYRSYPADALYFGQQPDYLSAVFNPELYLEWDKGNQLIQFKGFGRLNQYDTEQTHADLRELYYQRVFKKWEVSVGIKQIYWGFTESNHLVNVINQDDVLEGNDIENKLGQPMAHLSYAPKWGVIDLMVMPYFRTLTFPGIRGRGRPPFALKDTEVRYESDQEEFNTDMAIRWSHSIGAVDMGLSHFYGTNRTPIFEAVDTATFGLFHEIVNQTGLELQATTGAMLWKLEAINKISDRKTIRAFTLGGEYTFGNIYGADIGLLVEYTYDDRGEESINGLDDDFFVGIRIAFNDKQSTDFLGGVNIDNNHGTMSYFVEANRRIGDAWRVSIKGLGFKNIEETQFLYLLRNDGYVEFSLAHYF